MITPISGLVAAHILCTTLGLGGLVATNVWLAQMVRSTEVSVVGAALRASLTMNRIFGPLVGMGILLGGGLIAVTHVAALSSWLLVAYILIVIGFGLQGVYAIPWQIRGSRLVEEGAIATLDRRTPAIVAIAFAVNLALLIVLMVAQPHLF